MGEDLHMVSSWRCSQGSAVVRLRRFRSVVHCRFGLWNASCGAKNWSLDYDFGVIDILASLVVSQIMSLQWVSCAFLGRLSN